MGLTCTVTQRPRNRGCALPRVPLPAQGSRLVAVRWPRRKDTRAPDRNRRGRSRPAPVWSPDGNRIAFSVEATPTSGLDIGIVSADGRGEHPITRGLRTFNYNNPSWSPDGRRIAFDRYHEDGTGAENEDIGVMNADGRNLHMLTHDRHSTDPSWSPDGKQIAYVHDYQTIYVMNADGSNPVAVTSGAAPAWS